MKATRQQTKTSASLGRFLPPIFMLSLHFRLSNVATLVRQDKGASGRLFLVLSSVRIMENLFWFESSLSEESMPCKNRAYGIKVTKDLEVHCYECVN